MFLRFRSRAMNIIHAQVIIRRSIWSAVSLSSRRPKRCVKPSCGFGSPRRRSIQVWDRIGGAPHNGTFRTPPASSLQLLHWQRCDLGMIHIPGLLSLDLHVCCRWRNLYDLMRQGLHGSKPSSRLLRESSSWKLFNWSIDCTKMLPDFRLSLPRVPRDFILRGGPANSDLLPHPTHPKRDTWDHLTLHFLSGAMALHS